MLTKECCPVVNQPKIAMPGEQVGVSGSPIDIGYQPVEPDDGSRFRGVNAVSGAAIKGQGPRKEVHPEIGTGTRIDQLLNLHIRLGVTEFR